MTRRVSRMHFVLRQTAHGLFAGCIAVLLLLCVRSSSGQQIGSQPDGQDSIRVGLILDPLESSPEEGAALLNGSRMALEEASGIDGLNGQPISLVVRSMEGAWGSGSKQVASLAFDDRVVAILGTLSGRSAHLAEQVVTKAGVVFASTWTSDHTLSRINIPWFFSCMPDGVAQARALAGKISEGRPTGSPRIATVRDEAYDSRLAEQAFTSVAPGRGLEITARIGASGYPSQSDGEAGGAASSATSGSGPNTPSTAAAVEILVQGLRLAKPDVVVAFLNADGAGHLIERMEAEGMHPDLYGPMWLATDGFIKEARGRTGGTFVVVPGHWLTRAGAELDRKYETLFGVAAPAVAAYTYDCTLAVTTAIRSAGGRRSDIRDALSRTNFPDAATGALTFDQAGRRVGRVSVESVHDLQILRAGRAGR